jgi:general secretion pathway protein B
LAARPAPIAATPAADDALPWQRLPEAARQRIGPLRVSGAMHSPDPASRMLIVNNQVLREGDAIAPGVVLEEIQPRAAVLRVQGQRVLLSY